jgi:HEPN domain-containing protein
MLRMARKDLAALDGMLSEETFAEEVYGFHAQQAVEKALKCWLCVLTDEAPRTHDLEQLFGLLEEAGADVPAEFLDMMDLTDFAVIFRYGEIELDAGINRPAVLGQAVQLVKHIEGVLRGAEEQGA